MYGGVSGKHGRGGGNSRLSYPPPSSVRPPGRLGPGTRNNNNNNNRVSSCVNLGKPGSTAVGVEEHFSLVPGCNPLGYGMIIRLTPDLVEEIRKVEAQAGNAKIKFDANPNNTSENVIDVGGKDFRFTWSREMGGLCDIYEEHERGENGDGLLVESSCAWRKLNVQRVLDESTTSQVKMRSVEAQLRHKSRQAIVLDQGNPATKNQLKQLAAAESTPSRNSHKQKNEAPSKKRKFDSSPGGGPSRPLSQKPSLSSPASLKSARSASPLLSTPSRLGGSVSPYGDPKGMKNYARLDVPRSTQASSREDKPSSEKESIGKPTHGMHGNMGKESANSVYLHSNIFSILSKKPKGMTVKALDVAVGHAFPHATKEIELIAGSIATFQPASGRYVLRKESESESSKDQFLGIEGSNQNTRAPTHSHQQISAQETSVANKFYSEENQEKLRISSQEDDTIVEKEVIVRESDGPGNPNKSDDRAGSSSNSGSDSDSDTDSSDSRSDSESKSKSLVGSGSSSDSDSDASKNSREGSDIYVDIISEDEKEKKDKLASSGHGLSLSHVPFKTPDGRHSQNSAYDNEESYGHVRVEVEKIIPDEEYDIDIDVVTNTPPYSGSDRSQILYGSSLPIHNKYYEYENRDSTHNVANEHGKINNTGSAFNRKNKSSLDICNTDQNSDRFKQSKPGSMPPHSKSRSKKPEVFGHFTPYGMEKSIRMDSPSHMLKKCVGNKDSLGRSNVYYEGHLGLLSNNQPPCTVPVDHNGTENVSDNASKNKTLDNVGYASKNLDRLNRCFPSQYNKPYNDTHIEDVGIGNSYSTSSDSRSNKPEAVVKDDERYPFINVKRKKLERELSELELGELREHVPEEPLGIKKKFEKFLSKQDMSANQSQDPSKLTAVSTEPIESGKVMSPTSQSKATKNLEVPLKKRDTDKTKRFQQRTANLLTENDLDIDQVAIDKKIPTSKTKHGDKRKQVSQANAKTSADLIEVNDAHIAEQKKRESSSDENSCSYAKYEKDEPDLRGPIIEFSQYKEYVQEYNLKYEKYFSINKILESYRSEFLLLGKELENAKGKEDQERYNKALNRLMESYRQSGENHKRMKKTFLVFHEELKQLKETIKDFAAAYTKD